MSPRCSRSGRVTWGSYRWRLQRRSPRATASPTLTASLWPGNVGLVQVAIATPLKASYGVNYAHGVAFGFGLQAIEASVGIGVGLLFLAREGLSLAMLRVMPSAAQAEMSNENQDEEEQADERPERARMPG